MGSYNLCSSLTIPGLLPGSIKSKPDGFQMFSLLTPVVISLFFIRRDKFWLREISLPVNNAIKNKSGALLSVDPANSCARLCSCHCRLGTGRGVAHPGGVQQLLLLPLGLFPGLVSLNRGLASPTSRLLPAWMCGIRRWLRIWGCRCHPGGIAPILVLTLQGLSSLYFGDPGSSLGVNALLSQV